MINNIQALRAFAALAVVTYHVVVFAGFYGYTTSAWNWMDPWGAAGVDVFFVISGFIMVYTQHKSPKTAGAFFANRLIRIVPLYWALTLVMIALYLVLPDAFRQNGFNLEQSIHALMFTSGLAGFEYPVIQPGWTLEYEMGFYALLALAIALVPRRATQAVLLVLVASVLLGLNLIVLEFALGMIVAKLYIRGTFSGHGVALFAFGALALGYSAFFGLQSETGFDLPVHRFFLWGVPAAFLVLGACYMRQLSSRTILFLGAASYSIYLLQSFSMPVFFKFIAFVGVPEAWGIAMVPLCTLATAFGGGLLYLAFEKPVGRNASAWLKGRVQQGRVAPDTTYHTRVSS